MNKQIRQIILTSSFGVILSLILVSYLKLLTLSESLRQKYSFYILLLPIVGVTFMILYKQIKNNKSSFDILQTSKANNIFNIIILSSGTIASHLAGASVGRTKIAIKLSEKISELFFQMKNISIQELNIFYHLGIVYSLTVIFKSPLAAVIWFIFSGVDSKNIFNIFQSIIVSIISYGMLKLFELSGVNYPKIDFIQPTWKILLICCIIVIATIVINYLFQNSITVLQNIIMKFKNKYLLMIVIASIFILGLIYLIPNSQSYLGLSSQITQQAFYHNMNFEDFIWKFIFSVLCLGSFFQGGLINPLLDISVLFGATINLSLVPHAFIPSLMFIAMISSVTKSQVFAICLGCSYFGIDNIVYYLVISYIVVHFTSLNSLIAAKKIGE